MTNAELIEGLRLRGGDYIWTGRAVSLVETLDGTGIDPASPTLLDDMIARQGEFPQVEAWLDNLPGLASGHRAKAEEQLSYLTTQISAVAAA